MREVRISCCSEYVQPLLEYILCFDQGILLQVTVKVKSLLYGSSMAGEATQIWVKLTTYKKNKTIYPLEAGICVLVFHCYFNKSSQT